VSLLTWITLLAVGGLVWGGLACFLGLALRRERSRSDRERRQPGGR
jgi:hypothetical protein